MKRVTVVALALLLAVPAPVAGAMPHDSASPDAQVPSADHPRDALAQEEEPNTTSRLSPTGSVVSAQVAPSPDMSQTLQEADDAIASRVRTKTDQQRLSRADSAEERAAVAGALLDDIERRTERLKSDERAAVRAYANGSISANDLLRTLTRVHARSQILGESLDEHENIESSVQGYSESDRRSAIRDELAMLRTPVRAQLGRAYDGWGSHQIRLAYVDASSNGVVVELLSDGEYVRESVRFDNTDDNTTGSFGSDTSALLEYTQSELYPWALSNNPSVSFGGISENRYRLTIEHPQGTVSSYIDGSTREVFREVQRLDVDELPRSTGLTASNENLDLTIHRTPNNGPVRFNVTDSDGNPVNALVRVNGNAVGRTGTNGVLWALQPRSYYLVSASTGSTTINTTVGA